MHVLKIENEWQHLSLIISSIPCYTKSLRPTVQYMYKVKEKINTRDMQSYENKTIEIENETVLKQIYTFKVTTTRKDDILKTKFKEQINVKF